MEKIIDTWSTDEAVRIRDVCKDLLYRYLTNEIVFYSGMVLIYYTPSLHFV